MALQSVSFQTSTLATVPSGTKVAADALAGGEIVQYMKLVDGTPDSESYISGNTANGLDVDVTRVSGVVHVDDNSATLSVDDGGGSLTVDGAVSASITTVGQQAMAASVPVVIASNQSAVPVSGTFWQATQPVSGTFFQATQPVSIAATVTVDSELTTADLDTGAGTDTRAVVGLVYAGSGGATLVSAANPLPITGSVTAGGLADNGAFVDGTSLVSPAGFVFDEVAGTALTENDVAAARLDSKRAQVLVLEDETTRGRRATVTAAKELVIGGSGTAGVASAAVVTVQGIASGVAIPVTGSLTIGTSTDNGAFVDGTTSVVPSGFIFDEVAGTALTENDVAAARLDSKRAQVLVIEDATTRGQRAAVNASGALSVLLSNVVTEDIAAPTDPIGLPLMGRYRPALTSETSVSGRAIALDATEFGELFVKDTTARATLVSILADLDGIAANEVLLGATSYPEGNSYDLNPAGGVSSFLAIGALFDDVAPTALAEDKVGIFRQSANRNIYTQIRDGAGNERGASVSAAGALSVDVAKINAVTPLMGNGVTGTGSQRVTVASDNTPFAVKTDQTTHGTTDLVAADVTKLAGTAVDVNSGNKSAGTLRVVVVTDQPSLTNAQPVSSSSLVVSVTPTVSASPDYSIGDAVGGKQTIANAVRVSGGDCVLESIQVVDNANVKPQFEILFFDSDPTAATITDNAAFVFSTAKAKLLHRQAVVTADYVSIDSTAIATIGGINKLLQASGSTSLYAAVVADAAINLAATNDLRIDYGFLRD